MKLNRLASVLALFILSACAATALKAEAPAAPSRLSIAEAMFQERCKTAGEKILRTVDNVEGVLLLKIRPRGTNYGEQYAMDDPYGHDSTDDDYIKSFLYGRNSGGYLTAKAPVASLGYRYVEALDPADGKRYRYTLAMKEVTSTYSVLIGGDGKTRTGIALVLDKLPAPGAPPRYGVTFDDISTREEREYWIAGSSLKVIDLKTNEIIAERIGYMMDRGQGNQLAGRAPWLLAASYACPSFKPKESKSQMPGFSYQVDQTRNFVEKVLHPVQEK